MGLVTRVFGTNNDRELKQLRPRVEKINALEPQMKALSDTELSAKTAEFRQRFEQGELLDSILPEAFAVCREAAWRTLHMRHFDVQMIGGMVLHDGKIAEMKTGEGKTLMATLPVYLNALTGKGVHVVTVNDYLAKRDAEWMSNVYSFLGLRTDCVVNGLRGQSRKDAYLADITYGQNNEFGFDFLRDNMKLELVEKSQRGHYYAIVDEVDSILVDESRTPLIISGPADKPTELYLTADKIVRQLKAEVDYEVDLKSKQTTLTDEGVVRIEGILGVENLYDPQHIGMVHHINQSLKGHATMKRDVDYVVRGGQVIIVDEFTGRLMSGRRWSDGLHQAVEAKEGVQIQEENQTLATITFQNYFRMYEKLAGMTGTADTEAVEFKKIYDLDVVVVPTNEPMVRQDHPDVVYPSEAGKYRAVCQEIEDLHQHGQPILVGTASIASSEMLSDMLSKRGIKHHVLNAKQHESEAEIVAQAGRLGSVTIATNMAGRGTDIVLGGNPEFLAIAEFGEKDPENPEYLALLEKYEQQCAQERKKVLEVGGLHILGTERHESRRIDNQLRGRSGRQGDPGSSRFFVSLEDDLMKRFGGERIQMLMQRFGLKEDDALEGKLVARAIENSQRKVEGHHFDIRKHLLEYDDVMNKQREVIYGLRERVMHNDGLLAQLQEMIGDVIEGIILNSAGEKVPVEDWDIESICKDFSRMFGVGVNIDHWKSEQESGSKALAQDLYESFLEKAQARFEERQQHVGEENMERLINVVFLQSIDHFWKEHLAHMDSLKEGISLRGYGQKNPLHEYQRESYELFTSMMGFIKASVIQNIFLVELLSQQQLDEMEEREKEAARRVEEEATTIHESPQEAAQESLEDRDEGVGNRRQRRKAQVKDHVPTAVEIDSVSKSKKAQKRKKAKAAKKARKRAR